MNRVSLFVTELHRRNVFRTGAAYVVLAWVILQVADIMLPVFSAPTWVSRLLVTLLVIGFPIALLLSWVFDITAEGVKRTEDASSEGTVTHVAGRKLDLLVICILFVALSLSLYANLPSQSEPEDLPDPVLILIADFSNDTGNKLFTGVLEDALRTGVEVAQFVETYPRRDARLLALEIGPSVDKSSLLTTEVASLVAIRLGIDLVVSGAVRRSDKNIAVAIAGVDPADQKLLFELTQFAKSDDEVLAAIVSLARELREELGDEEVGDSAEVPDSFAVTSLSAATEYLIAQDYKISGSLDGAVTHFSRAIDIDPDFTRAYVGRALSLHYLGMSDLAAKDWEFVMDRLDYLTERDRLRTLGSYYAVAAQDWHKALEAYEHLVDRFPADNDGQNNLAVAAFYNLDFERARAAQRKVVERYPGHSVYMANLALYAMYAGAFDEAYELAQEVISQESQNALGWVAAALTDSRAGNIPEAREYYRKMMELGQRGKSLSYEGLADLALYEQNYGLAAEILVEGIEFDLGHSANETAAIKYVTLAEAKLQLGQVDEALIAIGHGLDIGASDNSEVRAAMLLTELNEIEKAEVIASELSNDLSNIRRAYASTIRAEIASSRNESVNAVELSKMAINTADLWFARFVLGKVYLNAGYPVEAYNEFQVCRNRIGEGLAVFLDDRPTFRMIRNLELAIDQTNLVLKQRNE